MTRHDANDAKIYLMLYWFRNISLPPILIAGKISEDSGIYIETSWVLNKKSRHSRHDQTDGNPLRVTSMHKNPCLSGMFDAFAPADPGVLSDDATMPRMTRLLPIGTVDDANDATIEHSFDPELAIGSRHKERCPYTPEQLAAFAVSHPNLRCCPRTSRRWWWVERRWCESRCKTPCGRS